MSTSDLQAFAGYITCQKGAIGIQLQHTTRAVHDSFSNSGTQHGKEKP